jgi:hypothetical protein
MELNSSEDAFSRSFSSERLTEQSLSFRVEGELNEEEREAIQQLVDGVASLSNSFYSGDLEAALQSSQALQFDGEDISGYSLDLRQTINAQVIAAYGDSPAQLPRPAALDAGVSELVAGSNLQSLFENVEAMIRDMLTGALQTHPQAPQEQPVADSGGTGLHWSAINASS